MFEHLDDPWPLDNHLADVGSVRRRGRRLQIRRWFAQAGVGAVATLTVAGAVTLDRVSEPRDATVVLASQPGAGEATTTTVAGAAGSTPDPAGNQPPTGIGTAGAGGTSGAAGGPAAPRDVPGAGVPGAVAPDPLAPGIEPGEPGGATAPPPGGTPAPPSADPAVEQIAASADATLEPAAKNANNGASRALRVQKPVAGIAAFDMRAVDLTSVTRATLRLTVCYTPGDSTFCPDAPSGWPAGGGQLAASRLAAGWERWVAYAGSGNQYPAPDNPRGSGAGVTWNCVTDAEVANEARDCSGADVWDGGVGVEGPARSSGLLTDAMANGTVIEFDVTADVQAGLGADSAYLSFFVRKLAQTGSGSVAFYSVEGAAAAGNAGFAPQLIVTH